MKYLIIFLSLFLDKGCTQSNINQDYISIEYSILSRGTYKQIIVNNKTVSKTNKRGGKLTESKYNEANWTKIMNILKTIDVENISSLEAPSKKFLFDGAPIANLKITYNDTIYETKPFDHGNPHKTIKLLIKEILSISENIE